MAEQSGTNKPKQDTGAENEDAKAIKALLSVASHERKNLQLLVDYFENKIPELDERKQFFDRVSLQVPESLQKLDFVSSQIEEIKTLDIKHFELINSVIQVSLFKIGLVQNYINILNLGINLSKVT